MKLDVLNLDGSKAEGSVELNPEVFGLEVRDDILSRVVHWQLSRRRAGTHETKEVGEISGSTKKIVKQKGTGGARHGSKRAPQFRGGAIIFGPVARSHGYSLPKKVRVLGLKMALSSKAKLGNLIIVDNVEVEGAKTKIAQAAITKIAPKNALIIDAGTVTDSAKKALANLYGYDILPTIGANVYDIVRKEKLIITKQALATLEERLNGK
ncbi:MAG: 50S ribosomal protein L4 [Holosporales bacterium]